MLFKTFFSELSTDGRKAFAEKVGTSVGHLTNYAYGYTTLAPAVCVSVERESGGKVTRQEMRDDWQAIWPELVKPQALKVCEQAN